MSIGGGSLRLCSTPEHQCKTLKSDNIIFSQEAGNNPSKSNDALTDIYYSFKGVRRYSIECAFPVEWQYTFRLIRLVFCCIARTSQTRENNIILYMLQNEAN